MKHEFVDKRWICCDCFYRNDIVIDVAPKYSRVTGRYVTDGKKELIEVRCEAVEKKIWDKESGGIIIEKCLLYKPDGVWNSG